MKTVYFLIMFALSLSCTTCTNAQSTSTSDVFHHNLEAIQNHSLTRIGATDSFKISLNFPCLFVGGFHSVTSGGKTVWQATQTYTHWDSLTVLESKNGALRFLDLDAARLSEDLLFMPGTYVLDWYKLTTRHLPSSLSRFGVSVLIFSRNPIP